MDGLLYSFVNSHAKQCAQLTYIFHAQMWLISWTNIIDQWSLPLILTALSHRIKMTFAFYRDVRRREVGWKLGILLCTCTLWGFHSVMMFSYLFFWKSRLPIGLYNSCSISPTAGGTFQKCLSKYHDWPDATLCAAIAQNCCMLL